MAVVISHSILVCVGLGGQLLLNVLHDRGVVGGGAIGRCLAVSRNCSNKGEGDQLEMKNIGRNSSVSFHEFRV